MALHFVGFSDSKQYWLGIQVFGPPDFVHRTWDVRARQEVVEGDVAVFAVGSIDDPPHEASWDDSQEDIRARGGLELVGLGKTRRRNGQH